MDKRERRAGTSAEAIELIEKRELCGRLKLSEWTLAKMVKAGTFPPPIWLGAVTPRWRLSEVEAWELDPARRERPKPQLKAKP